MVGNQKKFGSVNSQPRRVVPLVQLPFEARIEICEDCFAPKSAIRAPGGIPDSRHCLDGDIERAKRR